MDFEEYCPYCGSPNLILSNTLNESLKKSMGLEGKLDLGIIGLRMNKDGDNNKRQISFSFLYCITCKKTKRLKSPSFPLYYISLYPIICVIPSSLLTVMRNFKYDDADAHNLLIDQKNNLHNIYIKYLESNSNPIEEDIIGYKIKFIFKNYQDNYLTANINCWIIIDLIEDGLDTRQVFRITHQVGAF